MLKNNLLGRLPNKNETNYLINFFHLGEIRDTFVEIFLL